MSTNLRLVQICWQNPTQGACLLCVKHPICGLTHSFLGIKVHLCDLVFPESLPRPKSPQQWPQDWKRSVISPIPKKGNASEYSNYCAYALILHASKVTLKILQAKLQQYVNWELPDVQAGFRKAEEPEIKLPTSVGSWKKQGIPEKLLLLLHWLHQSPWLCGSQQTMENS